MHKLKMQSLEKVCDYCNIHYPDERSLMVHEFIHVDRGMDYFQSGSEISDQSGYLPKAKQLLPNGMRNNRFFEVRYKKVQLNMPGIGKRYSKMFLISDAIDEMLYLCKRYPVRESEVCEMLPEYDIPTCDKIPDLLYSSPNYASLISESSPATSYSSESSLYEWESEQNEVQINHQANIDQAITDSPKDMICRTSNEDSALDSGYGSSPQDNHSEILEKELNLLPESTAMESTDDIKELLKNIVSLAAGKGNNSVTEKLNELQHPVVEEPDIDKFIIDSNSKLDFKDPETPVFEPDRLIIPEQFEPNQKVVKVYSMPHILC